MSRPELIAPPESELSQRAIELLNLPEGKDCFILDVGCGSGLSGEELEEAGHTWVGVDISKDMLNIAVEREGNGDVFCLDMGSGLPFRPGVFDGCISISAIQWLCYSDKAHHTARKRLMKFFSSLYVALKSGSRAVLQLYPETPEQMEEISSCAMKSGFSGGLVIDYPNSAKAKKYYLCLFAGMEPNVKLPKALNAEEGVQYERRRLKKNEKKGKRACIKAKDWVTAKKERQRLQGKEVRRDSKYTARRRPSAF